MFGRIAARLLVQALRSAAVQSAAVEASRYVARRSTAFLLRKLRAGSRTFNDASGARGVGGSGAF